ncbi:ATP-binding cassette domain-containing protein [Enterobacter hormaechei]|nr:ATP-binding cassette domain-containing protein [Enterobacter hormaechei]
MIVFSSLQIRRGVRVLLDNATATINPGQKVGLVGKNGCGKSTLLALLKNEISADGGNFTFPGNWQLAWVNQETPALSEPALDYVIDGDREYRKLEAELNAANERNDGHAIATVHGKLDAIDAWTIRSRASSLLHGLGFSNEQLERPVSDFSGGWRMRLNLAQALICRSDLLLLDEPTNHLDLDAVIWLEKWLKSYQGTLILISHDRDFLDPVVDKIIHIEQQSMFEYTGNYSSFERQRATRLAQQQAMYESQQQRVAHLQSFVDRFKAKASKAKQAQSRIKMLERMEMIAPAHVDNPFHFSFREPESLPNPLLKMEKVSAGYGDRIILDSIKLNLVPGSRIGLLGRNGAGKSTLINDTLFPIAQTALNGATLAEPAPYRDIQGLEHFDKVIDIDQSPIGRTPRSNPATYTGVFTPVRELFAGVPEARSRGYTPGRFSFNVRGGRCEACQGDGVIKVEMHFLPDIYVPCDQCKGKRYNRETLEIKYKGKTIHEVLDMTIEEAREFFDAVPALARKLQTLMDVGLTYIRLGQSATTLSGGEAQRVKLARELSKRGTGQTLYILDEPTTGLHFADIQQLLDVLHQLRDQGNTIVVIEHNLDVIKTADWIVDLGPEGGSGGGEILVSGTPETVAECEASHTARFLKPLL